MSIAMIVALHVAVGAAVAAGPALDAVRYRPRGPLEAASAEELRVLHVPTRGDLGRDRGYLKAVLRSWADGYGTGRYLPDADGFVEVREEPRVLWAGTTPAGRAAVVGQLNRLQWRNKREFRRDYVLLGFIAPGSDGRPTMVGVGGPSRMFGFLVGADRSVLVVLDLAVAVGYALGRSRPIAGQEFTPLQFRDGAAVVPIPPQRSFPATVVAVRLPFRGDNDEILLGNEPPY